MIASIPLLSKNRSKQYNYTILLDANVEEPPSRKFHGKIIQLFLSMSGSILLRGVSVVPKVRLIADTAVERLVFSRPEAPGEWFVQPIVVPSLSTTWPVN